MAGDTWEQMLQLSERSIGCDYPVRVSALTLFYNLMIFLCLDSLPASGV